MAGKLWEWFKMSVVLAAIVFVWLGVEYGDNCTRYRAPWCDFLDEAFSLLPAELVIR